MLTAATGGLTVPTLIAINDLDADGRESPGCGTSISSCWRTATRR